jgi:hypothetical protein
VLTTLQPLLELKSYREAREARALERQRRALKDAQARLARCEQELKDFQSQAQAREQALFGALYGQVVRLPKIQAVHAQVDELRAEERAHAKKVEQAETERHRQDQELQLRRQAHGQALQAKERFVEVVRVATEDAHLEADRADALEIEEVVEARVKGPGDAGALDVGAA